MARSLSTEDGQRHIFPKYGPIQSFRDLSQDSVPPGRMKMMNRAARHLAFLVESLTDFRQLNLAPNRNRIIPAISHAIYMPEVIHEKQVVYFYLVGAMDVASVAQIAKLAAYSLLMAAIAYHDKPATPPHLHHLGRGPGHDRQKHRKCSGAGPLARPCVHPFPPGPESTQSSRRRRSPRPCDELHGGQAGLWRRDPWLLRYISETSGTTKYFRLAYGWMAPGHPLNEPRWSTIRRQDGEAFHISIQEYTGPRLTYQDILNISREPNLSLMWIDRISGLSLFQGWFPMHTDWPVSKTVHEAHQGREPWPAKSEATIEMSNIWPP